MAEGTRMKEIDLIPSSANAHSDLGAAYHSMGRLQEAEAEYRAALKLNPDHPNARENLAALLLQKAQGFGN